MHVVLSYQVLAKFFSNVGAGTPSQKHWIEEEKNLFPLAKERHNEFETEAGFR